MIRKSLELGNLMFNPNKNQNHICPDYVLALLKDIESRLEITMINIGEGKDYDSPFDNTGANFEIENLFRVEAYNWNDDIVQEYNFIYYPKNIRISWYKYLGRDDTVNKNFSPKTYIKMYNDCIEGLYKYQKEKLKENGIYDFE